MSKICMVLVKTAAAAGTAAVAAALLTRVLVG
jgi:hypothetical protein